ncbi:MAG TPA: helix-turn-helix domain-containing protein [Thermoanaerobaculia bacterium]|nr:helix-turn-helix domain-containing protein [Thermoanaerobaculia bacterium]
MNAQQAQQHLPEKSNSRDGEVTTYLSTTKQAAQYLCLEPQTLEVWMGRGKGPAFVKIGVLVRYERRELDTFIERNRRRNTSDRPPTSPERTSRPELVSSHGGGRRGYLSPQLAYRFYSSLGLGVCGWLYERALRVRRNRDGRSRQIGRSS